jgi:hypothetical protein
LTHIKVRSAFVEYEPAPDVWWGDDGIDALIWADPLPYADPLSMVPPTQDQAPSVEGGAA